MTKLRLSLRSFGEWSSSSQRARNVAFPRRIGKEVSDFGALRHYFRFRDECIINDRHQGGASRRRGELGRAADIGTSISRIGTSYMGARVKVNED